MPALLLPAGLIALAALALPLLIHLARRTEQRPTDFAALRWLRERPRPRHRPRFDERLLLAARLLLLVLVALWLARPVWTGAGDGAPVVAIVPGVDPAMPPPADGARTIWLAAGFPVVDRPVPAGPVPVGSLLRELDASLSPGTPLTIVAPAMLVGADAERPRLSRAVTWRVVPGTMPAPAAGYAPPPPTLAIRRVAAREGEARYLRAAAAATRMAVTTGDAARPIPAGATNLAWIAPGPLPKTVVDWIARGGVAIVGQDTPLDGPATPVWRDPVGMPLAEAVLTRQGRVLRFTRPLAPSVMPALLEPDFPDQFHKLMMPAPMPTRVGAQEYRPSAGGPDPVVPTRDLRPWLAVAIAGLWLIERWLATGARRAIAP